MKTDLDDYYFEKVSPTYLSSDAHTPLIVPRATQSTVGVFLQKKSPNKDEMYGVHHTCYGGVGEAVIPTGMTLPGRGHNHLRTGILQEITEPINEDWRMAHLRKNNLSAHPINQFGYSVKEISENFKSMDVPQKVKKQLFPRSFVYEFEYILEQNRKIMLEELAKLRAAYEASMYKSKKPSGTVGTDVSNTNKDETSLQYGNVSDPQSLSMPIKQIDAKTDKMHKHSLQDVEQRETITLKQKGSLGPKLIDNENDVKKSDIIKNVYPGPEEWKEEEKCWSVCYLCGCKTEKFSVQDMVICDQCTVQERSKERKVLREPGPTEFGKTDLAGNPCEAEEWPRQSWANLREKEFLMVGRPFSHEAIQRMECKAPPIRPPPIKKGKKCIPGWGFPTI